MTVQLDKISPRFRQLTDLLCFSDKLDLDLTDFKHLLKENFNDHYDYLWDRLLISFDIFWENGEQFWSNRFNFLFSLNEKILIKNIEELLEKRMFQLVREKEHIDVRYDTEYQQFVEFCKIKHLRNESLSNIKDYLIDLPSQTRLDKLINVVSSFTPFVFASMEDYAEQLSGKITHSASNFDFLLALEERGLTLNRVPIVQIANELIVARPHSEKNCLAFLYLIHDKGVRDMLKIKYHISCRSKLLSLLNYSTFRMLESRQFFNIKSLLELDPFLADDLIILYAKKIYDRHSSHKMANPDKLVRLVKTCPEISSRRIIAFLSTNNKVPDIKYIVSAFPELKKLAAFV
jgi:hypothetical protein